MTAPASVAVTPGFSAAGRAGPPRGLHGWLRGYLLMLRFDLSSQRQWLPFGLILQVLLGAGMAVIYGFYAPHLSKAGLLYLVTGAPAVALVPFGMLAVPLPASETAPVITLVVNVAGGSPVIAPNTWVEINGSNLSAPGDARTWQGSDFTGGQMPTELDGVSVTVNGRSAYIYYISPTQINFLTPPDDMAPAVAVVVSTTAGTSAAFTAQAASISPATRRFSMSYRSMMWKL